MRDDKIAVESRRIVRKKIIVGGGGVEVGVEKFDTKKRQMNRK